MINQLKLLEKIVYFMDKCFNTQKPDVGPFFVMNMTEKALKNV